MSGLLRVTEHHSVAAVCWEAGGAPSRAGWERPGFHCEGWPSPWWLRSSNRTSALRPPGTTRCPPPAGTCVFLATRPWRRRARVRLQRPRKSPAASSPGGHDWTGAMQPASQSLADCMHALTCNSRSRSAVDIRRRCRLSCAHCHFPAHLSSTPHCASRHAQLSSSDWLTAGSRYYRHGFALSRAAPADGPAPPLPARLTGCCARRSAQGAHDPGVPVPDNGPHVHVRVQVLSPVHWAAGVRRSRPRAGPGLHRLRVFLLGRAISRRVYRSGLRGPLYGVPGLRLPQRALGHRRVFPRLCMCLLPPGQPAERRHHLR